MDDHADVLVAGAGPTGLLLAGDLARAGVRCAILERRTEESNLTRAFAVHARTLEILDARGVADQLTATGAHVSTLRIFGRLRVQLSGLPTRYPYVLVTPQYNTEQVLEQRARRLGVRIVRGAEVVGMRQDASGVEVDVRDSRGAVSPRTAAYVVGADGVRSRVRAELGLAFPGRSAVMSVILADVRLAEQPPDVLTVNAVGDGFAFIAPFGDGWFRVIAWNRRRQLPDTAPVELAEIREIVRSALGTDYGMHSPRWMSRFHSDERQVESYRVGRVFLAGDAAHVHSPAGGQGMNTGLQDAANLGWKLAAAIQGWAPHWLLDSYHTERHPVGQAVLQGSGALLRLALAQSTTARVARGVLANGLGRVGWVPPRASRVVSGLAVRYPAPAGQHRLVGTRAPDIRLRGVDGGVDGGPGWLYQRLRDGRFVLVGRDPRRGADPGWANLVGSATVDDAMPAAALLVRPDGYVAWATDEAQAAARERAIRAALGDWCGEPQGYR
jgi:2-polyprenyl-6-methoxyphenol hydroxylase-like FAD-dependent oxidoreductase